MKPYNTGNKMLNNTKRLECKAIMFDLDGVLVDSSESIVHHWKMWAEKHNLDLAEIMRNSAGMRSIETMRIVAPHLDLEKESAEFEENEINDKTGTTAYDGAYQLLTSLPHGKWAIVSSGSPLLIKTRLKVTGLPEPELIITAHDVVNGKPSPEPYLLGAERLGLAPGDCVVVEDAPAGVESGHKAGTKVIGVASTHTKEELLAKGADFVVDKLNNIIISKSVNNDGLVIEML